VHQVPHAIIGLVLGIGSVAILILVLLAGTVWIACCLDTLLSKPGARCGQPSRKGLLCQADRRTLVVNVVWTVGACLTGCPLD